MGEGKQFCTFYLEENLYGIPVQEVQEVIREQAMTRVPLAPAAVRGLINLRGQIVTAIDLRERLGLGARKNKGHSMNVVVKSEESIVSFLVDAIGDVVDVQEKAFEAVPETLRGKAGRLLIGVYKLEGGLLHVLDARRSAQIEDLKTSEGGS